MPTDIQTLIDAIPIAEDGHVITSEYHNRIRDALRALAGLGQGTSVQDHVLTLAPTFFSDSATDVWEQPLGRARKDLAAASGWLAFQLPDGARLQKMKVTCKRTGSLGLLDVRLDKIPVISENPILIAAVQFPATPPPGVLSEPANPFGAFARIAIAPEDIIFPGGVTIEDLDPTIKRASSDINAAHVTIDNANNKYLIEAKLQAVPPSNVSQHGSTQILAIQLFYAI